MRTDAEIQKDVMDQLRWVPFLNPGEIGVAVKDGVVTLTGEVEWNYQSQAAVDAEWAAWSAPGVTSVENRLTIAVKEYTF
ncbi:MAG: BON domain-containing protein [Chitinophagaceae bacterium]|nr:BON domain-containing protein [Chitinophagaceae bacterium]